MKRRSLLGLIAGAFAPVPLVSGKPEEPKVIVVERTKTPTSDHRGTSTYEETRVTTLEDLSRFHPMMTEEGRRAYDRDLLAEALEDANLATRILRSRK